MGTGRLGGSRVGANLRNSIGAVARSIASEIRAKGASGCFRDWVWRGLAMPEFLRRSGAVGIICRHETPGTNQKETGGGKAGTQANGRLGLGGNAADVAATRGLPVTIRNRTLGGALYPD